jgi:glycosyltransferase involved in cell wall biosynthesis
VNGPRILAAQPFPDVYGADRVMLDAVLGLRDAGMEPTLVLPEPGPMTAWLDAHELQYRSVAVPVLRRALLRPARLAGLAAHAPRDVALVRRTISEVGADLVYANTITLPHWILGARLSRVPVMAHVHESDDRIRPGLVRALAAPLLAADRVVTVSEAVRRFLCTAIPRLRDRTVVVYNGVEAPADDFPLPLTEPRARLAVIGRLGPNKGQDLAVQAVDTLVRSGRDVELVLAGDTFAGYEWFEADLRASVRRLGLERRVRFAGFVDDVWDLLRDTDLVLAPSRADSLPLVVIEAMLAGRPVIASDVGGMSELIASAVTGVLVPPEDVPSLDASIRSLLDDPLRARRLGEAARATAVARFDLGRFRREMVEVAQSVLNPNSW